MSNNTELYLAWYPHNQQGAELISYGNTIFKQNGGSTFFTESGTVDVGEYLIQGTWVELRLASQKRRLIYYFYRIPNIASSNEVEVKLRQTLNVSLGKESAGALVAISLESYKSKEKQKAIITDTLRRYVGQLDQLMGFE